MLYKVSFTKGSESLFIIFMMVKKSIIFIGCSSLKDTSVSRDMVLSIRVAL